MDICIIDSTGLAPMELAAAVSAINTQITLHLGPSWSVAGHLVVGNDDAGPTIVITDDPAIAGRLLGQHFGTQPPRGVVSPANDRALESQWSVSLSHEALEMLVDPRLDAVFSGTINGAFSEYLKEICDPVHADADGYYVGNVLVSDFVTPSWFDPNTAADARTDHVGRLSGPFTLSENDGYATRRDGGLAGNEWVTRQRNAQRPSARSTRPHGRLARAGALSCVHQVGRRA